MKPSVTPDATRAVLADIADAVRPVERARTAAAVERVLRTATADLWGEPAEAALHLADLYEDLGVTRLTLGELGCDCNGECRDDDVFAIRDDATPGMVTAHPLPDEAQVAAAEFQRRRYAPWVVSPHLFDQRSDPTPSGSNQRRRVTTEQGER